MIYLVIFLTVWIAFSLFGVIQKKWTKMVSISGGLLLGIVITLFVTGITRDQYDSAQINQNISNQIENPSTPSQTQKKSITKKEPSNDDKKIISRADIIGTWECISQKKEYKEESVDKTKVYDVNDPTSKYKYVISDNKSMVVSSDASNESPTTNYFSYIYGESMIYSMLFNTFLNGVDMRKSFIMTGRKFPVELFETEVKALSDKEINLKELRVKSGSITYLTCKKISNTAHPVEVPKGYQYLDYLEYNVSQINKDDQICNFLKNGLELAKKENLSEIKKRDKYFSTLSTGRRNGCY